MDDFHIYVVDMVGHPGKSAETSLPARGYDYGIWISEVIDGLKYDKISLFGGSFGAGVIAKTMCTCPDKVKRVVLYVPSGIKNAPAINSASMIMPMIAYWVTGKGVIERAQKIIPDCTAYLLEGRGHMNFLTNEEKKMIVDFLLR